MSREYRIFNAISHDETYCFSKGRPSGAYVPLYLTTEGESIATDYPTDQFSVELSLDPDWTGIKLPSSIGNPGELIILHKDVANFIQQGFDVGSIETFAFTLINHKGRVHSKDYVFFNPLESRDCLDLNLSEARRRKAGEIKDLTRVVLDRQKLLDTPDVFRIGEYPSAVLFSEELIKALKSNSFTNFQFTDVEYNKK